LKDDFGSSKLKNLFFVILLFFSMGVEDKEMKKIVVIEKEGSDIEKEVSENISEKKGGEKENLEYLSSDDYSSKSNAEKSNEVKPESESEIQKLKSEVERLKNEVEDYKSRWIYTFSEYENYRKRVRIEIENAVKDALSKVFINIISALDSLDVALNYIKDEQSRKGVELVRQIIIKALIDSGLKELEISEGQKFSPDTCEVLDFVFSDEYEDETIIKVLRKGYEFQGRVIRPAQVVVSKRKNSSQETDESLKRDEESKLS
jgi:molecular chaperone GrpE